MNPRYTASIELLERAFGFSAIAAHVAACRGRVAVGRLGGWLPSGRAAISNRNIFGKAIIYATRDIEVDASFSEFVRFANAGQRWPVIADIPRSGTNISCGDPIVTVFAEAASDAAVVHSLQNSSAHISSFFEKEYRSP